MADPNPPASPPGSPRGTRGFRALSRLACLALLLASAAWAIKPPPKSDDRLTALMAKMQAVQKGVQTLRVNFTQTNRFSMLSKPQVMKGTLVLQKPTTALYSYKSPVSLTFRVKDGDLLVYNSATREAYVQDIRRHEGKIMRYLGITQPLEELQKHFTVTLTSTENGTANLCLSPAQFHTQRKIAAMYFTVGTEDGLIRDFEILEPGGDKIQFSFQDWEINPKLTEKDFEIAIPPGVKVKRQMLDLKEPFGK
jgi:outer membrane lipoprotein-sorting protein